MKQSRYIYLTVIFLIVVLMVSGALVVHNRHQTRLYTVVEKEIMEAAKQCKLDEKCQKEISLNNLYEYKYLTTKLFNPITKKIYSKDLIVDLSKEKIDWIDD